MGEGGGGWEREWAEGERERVQLCAWHYYMYVYRLSICANLLTNRHLKIYQHVTQRQGALHSIKPHAHVLIATLSFILTTSARYTYLTVHTKLATCIHEAGYNYNTTLTMCPTDPGKVTSNKNEDTFTIPRVLTHNLQ